MKKRTTLTVGEMNPQQSRGHALLKDVCKLKSAELRERGLKLPRVVITNASLLTMAGQCVDAGVTASEIVKYYDGSTIIRSAFSEYLKDHPLDTPKPAQKPIEAKPAEPVPAESLKVDANADVEKVIIFVTTLKRTPGSYRVHLYIKHTDGKNENGNSNRMPLDKVQEFCSRCKQSLGDKLTIKLDGEVVDAIGDVKPVEKPLETSAAPVQKPIITPKPQIPIPKVLQGKQHPQFRKVCCYVRRNLPVYLTGDAGTGKSYLAKQVADALGMTFYSTQQITDTYTSISGFKDANGVYHETEFYKAFTQGGLFFIDEFDASVPEAVIALNGAIANGRYTFPNGVAEAHPNFRIIAAGNTFGTGADVKYTGRAQLDASTLDRFGVVEVDYDRDVEMHLANNNKTLVDFCESLRAIVKNNGMQLLISMRPIANIAALEDDIKAGDLTLQEVLKDWIFKGTTIDDMNTIYDDLPSSKYKDAMKQVIEAARAKESKAA